MWPPNCSWSLSTCFRVVHMRLGNLLRHHSSTYFNTDMMERGKAELLEQCSRRQRGERKRGAKRHFLTYSVPARHLGSLVFGVIVPRDHIRGFAELHCVVQFFLRWDWCHRSAKQSKNKEDIRLTLHAVVGQTFAYLQLFCGINCTKLIHWYAVLFGDHCKEFLDGSILIKYNNRFSNTLSGIHVIRSFTPSEHTVFDIHNSLHGILTIPYECWW